MDLMNFNDLVDQIFLVLIAIAMIASIVIPFNRYMKDREGYPFFQVLATCFYLNSAFVAFITLVSYVRSLMTLESFSKTINAFITLQIPSSLYAIIAVTCFIVAIGLSVGAVDRRY